MTLGAFAAWLQQQWAQQQQRMLRAQQQQQYWNYIQQQAHILNQSFVVYPNGPNPGWPTSEESMQVAAPRVWFDENTATYATVFPYDADFLNNTFKLTIPREHRSWDAANKRWQVSSQIVQQVVTMLKKRFGSCEFIPRVETAPTEVSGDLYREFCLLVGAESLTRAYRDAALRMHPDKAGGDSRKMARLNELWTNLKGTL